MKTFREFCHESNLNEIFGFNFSPPKPPPPKPPTTVLAYRNYQPGVLNKDTNRFIPRAHSPREQRRYGWRPVFTSSYSPGDKYTPNKVTATGAPHNWSTMNAAVPFRYALGQAPTPELIRKPSIDYGSTLHLTTAPMGRNTKITRSAINDVGNFGSTGEFNKGVSFDLSPATVRSVLNDRTTPNSQISSKWGLGRVYARVTPPPPKSKPKPSKK